MNNLTVISQRIGDLRSLSTQDAIYLDDLREEFRQDLKSFIAGETLSIRNGKLAIGVNLYKQWLDKIKNRGFDYEIDFKR